MPTTIQATPQQLRVLDCLRGILALYVVATHARWLLWLGVKQWRPSEHPWWADGLAFGSIGLRLGHEAVMVFFVLSGLFIHLRLAQQLSNREPKPFSIANFYRRRLHRLAPPYFLALLVTIVLDLLGRSICPEFYAGQLGDETLRATFAHMNYSWQSVLPAAVFLPRGLGENFGTNGAIWSIGFEFAYYAIYPLWAWLRIKVGRWAFVIGLVVGLFAATIGHEDQMFWGLIIDWPIWLGGALIAEMLASRRLRRVRVWSALILIPLGALIAEGSRMAPFHDWVLSEYLGMLGHGMVGCGTVFLCLCMPTAWLQFRPLRWAEWIGFRSYSIYIFHFPVLALLSALAYRQWGERPVSGWYAMLGGVVSVIVGVLLFEVCERHFIHRSPPTPPQQEPSPHGQPTTQSSSSAPLVNSERRRLLAR
jgi:peptidoglycan/LPS O-acetylase OafA/YrhL